MTGGKMLIVDDEKAFAESVAEFFTDRGFETRTAGCVKDALSVARDFVPDVVLTDLKMPEASGLDLLETFRSIGTGPIVILMTAYGDLSDVWRSLHLRADGFIRKPLSMDRLAQIVEEIQARREVKS